MYFNFACTHCGKNLKVREELAGRRARCPHCKATVTVPMPEVASTPDLPAELDLTQLNFNDPLGPGPGALDPLAATTATVATARNVKAAPVARTKAAKTPAPAAAKQASAPDTDGTNVSLFKTAMIGLGLTILFYAALYPLPPMYFRDLFFDRGWVTVAEAYLLFWSIAVLVFKSRLLKRQKDSMLFDLLPDDIGKDITAQNLPKFTANVRGLPVAPGSSFLVQRVLRGLEHFGVRQSASEVSGMLGSQSEIDNSAVASSYAMLNVFIWAIPILGFIGTVQGLGNAVGSLSSSLEAASDVESIKESLGAITGGLGVAFDTTLVALIMALFLKFPAASMQKAEEDLLTWVDEYCNENLLKRLQESGDKEGPSDPASRTLQRAIDAALVPHQAELRSWYAKLKEIGKSLTEDVLQGWTTIQSDLQTQHGERIGQITQVVESLAATSAQVGTASAKLLELQEAQANQFTATAAAIDSQAESLEQQAHEHQVRIEAQLGQFVEHSKLSLAPIAEEAEAAQAKVAAAVEQSSVAMQTSLGSLQQALENLNEVLSELGGQQVVIQQAAPERRGWSLFGGSRANGKHHG